MPYASLTPPCKLLLTYNLHSTYHLYQFYLSSSLLCVIWHIRPYFYHVKSLNQISLVIISGENIIFIQNCGVVQIGDGSAIETTEKRYTYTSPINSSLFCLLFPLPLWLIFHAVLCMKLFYYNTCTWCMTTDYFQHCNLLNNREWNVGKLY